MSDLNELACFWFLAKDQSPTGLTYGQPIEGTVWEEGASGNDPKQRKKIETYQNTAVHDFGHYLGLEHPRHWIDSKNPDAYGRAEKERRRLRDLDPENSPRSSSGNEGPVLDGMFTVDEDVVDALWFPGRF